jgi:hypothetical protein
MTSRDQPANRSLDGRTTPGDRARPPEELLDNLRLRLSQLADNHPSAPREWEPDCWREDDDAGHPVVASDDRLDEVTRDGSAQGGSFADLHCAVDLTGSQGRAGPGRSTLTQAAGWAADAARAAGGGVGALATTELPVRGGTGDPYRPWFMAGELGSPWWASGSV